MSAAPTLPRLRSLRNRHDTAALREQRALLRDVAALRLRRWRDLQALHEDLLFLCAFAGSAAIARAARAALGATSQRLRALPAAERARADDSGIAGSITRQVYPFPLARWLAREEAADIDWRNVVDETALGAVLRARLAPAAREAFDSGDYGAREFAAIARPAACRSDLQWLSSDARAQGDWDRAEASIVWRLGESRRSVTRNVLAGVARRMRTGLRRPPADVRAAITAPLDAIELLPRRRAAKVIDCARAALTARCREVDAMTYPNLDEVWWCDLGEGVALAVIGIAHERRLALETNTGYLLLANGVPIGYGGVTPLFRQANTGINIFEPFRGSEAAFLWVQMLRAFHTLYGSTRFIINAYQFGAGNAEAIRSGAFWFYYRLGFRPQAAAIAALAEREAKRLAADRDHRSDARTLRALASCDLHLDLPGFSAADHFDEPLLPRAGERAARMLAAGQGGPLALARELGIDDCRGWPQRERAGFGWLAPVFTELGSERWAQADRDALACLLRAKGLPQERTFALRATRAARAFRALRAALQAGRSPSRPGSPVPDASPSSK